jgi:exodeoxyribonuclease-3
MSGVLSKAFVPVFSWDTGMIPITISTLNIAAASDERAQKLLHEWIVPNSHDVYVFTETSEGKGTAILASAFQDAGWAWFQHATVAKDRGVAIATCLAGATARGPENDPGPGRALVVHLSSQPPIEIVGMYVPNRGNDWAKADRKEAFLRFWLDQLRTRTAKSRILLGDLNVVPLDQRPVFLPQLKSEYEWFKDLERVIDLYDAAVEHAGKHESTWVAHTGEGYTYDHILPQKCLAERVCDFAYDHSTRTHRALTDHSALVLTVQVDDVERRVVRPVGEPSQIQLF